MSSLPSLEDWLDDLFNRCEEVRRIDVSERDRLMILQELVRRGFDEWRRGAAEAWIIFGNWRYKGRDPRLEPQDFFPSEDDLKFLKEGIVPVEYVRKRLMEIRAEVRRELEQQLRADYEQRYSETALTNRLEQATATMMDFQKQRIALDASLDDCRKKVRQQEEAIEQLRAVINQIVGADIADANATARKSTLIELSEGVKDLQQEALDTILLGVRCATPNQRDGLNEQGSISLTTKQQIIECVWFLRRPEFFGDIYTARGYWDHYRFLQSSIPKIQLCLKSELKVPVVVQKMLQQH